MPSLSPHDKAELIRRLEAGESLPAHFRALLFPDEGAVVPATKEYRLVYEGKKRREEVIADTPEAPFQIVRRFNEDNRFPDGWRNLLIFGDNLLALKETYADQQGANRYGTKDKIKLIYIDPPFATRQDFMKDREKAYRDKVLGAQFIEFLRRRLILLHEVLADDGSIYVHLDSKKGHYIKAVLDEVFGEENFRNEIIWRRSTSHSDAQKFGQVHDAIYFYTKGEQYIWNTQYKPYTKEYVDRYFRFREPDGRRYWKEDATGQGDGPPRRFGSRMIKPPQGRHWRWIQETIDKYWKKGRFVLTSSGKPEFKRYLDEQEGEPVASVWDDLKRINMMADERTAYPTQKPESILERMIRASSNEGDIVLDAFVGSGTTVAVAEKLGRRWIAIDCGKLAIYTAQKRLFSLTTSIGAAKKDDRSESERIEGWGDVLKAAPALMLITEKARKGECKVTLDLLADLAKVIDEHDLAKDDSPFCLACPEEKLQIPASKLKEPGEDDGAGNWKVSVEGHTFLITFIAPREKTEMEQPLRAKAFDLCQAGVYDNQLIKGLPWADYLPFVLKLFQVREHPHAIKGFDVHGYIGIHSAYVWNYPEQKNLRIDHEWVESLHREGLRGSAGDRFYVIVPVVAMAFAEDHVRVGDTTYVFLKVPISVILRLLEAKVSGALRQPTKEADVNEVIDAVGFDFVSQPVVEVRTKREKPKRKGGQELFPVYMLHLTEFRSKTLASDPDDFENFETFSMAMVDGDYDCKVFRLGKVFWADDLVTDEVKRLELKAGSEKEKFAACERLELRIEDDAFPGKQMMVIFCDKYGNEKKLVFAKGDFR